MELRRPPPRRHRPHLPHRAVRIRNPQLWVPYPLRFLQRAGYRATLDRTPQPHHNLSSRPKHRAFCAAQWRDPCIGRCRCCSFRSPYLPNPRHPERSEWTTVLALALAIAVAAAVALALVLALAFLVVIPSLSEEPAFLPFFVRPRKYSPHQLNPKRQRRALYQRGAKPLVTIAHRSRAGGLIYPAICPKRSTILTT